MTAPATTANSRYYVGLLAYDPETQPGKLMNLLRLETCEHVSRVIKCCNLPGVDSGRLVAYVNESNLLLAVIGQALANVPESAYSDEWYAEARKILNGERLPPALIAAAV